MRVDTNTGEIIDRGFTAVNDAASHPTDNSRAVTPIDVISADNIRLVGRFSDLYLLMQAGDDLYIVDQHTAHECVLFEETLRKIEQHQMVGQHLLLPVQVEFNPEQFAVFTEAEQLLSEVRVWGGRVWREDSAN